MVLIATSHPLSRRAQSGDRKGPPQRYIGPSTEFGSQWGNVPGNAARSDTGQNAIRWRLAIINI
jgi:hypothetical protein